MRATILTVLVSFLVLSGLAVADQSGEQKQDPSMMGQMMKEGKSGDQSERMMRMMKMMDQCASMMESAQAKDGKTEPSQPK